MLTLTDSAVTAIRNLTSQPELPDDTGLRIMSQDEGGPAFQVTLADSPVQGDQVIETEGARVFLEPGARWRWTTSRWTRRWMRKEPSPSPSPSRRSEHPAAGAQAAPAALKAGPRARANLAGPAGQSVLNSPQRVRIGDHGPRLRDHTAWIVPFELGVEFRPAGTRRPGERQPSRACPDRACPDRACPDRASPVRPPATGWRCPARPRCTWRPRPGTRRGGAARAAAWS